MNLLQAFKMAVKSLLANKGRSFLTMLGIIIGIASVMTIVSTINGMNRKTMAYYESMGTNKINVSAYRHDGQDVFEELYSYCQSLEGVVGITPNAYFWGTLRYGARGSDSMNYSPQMYLGSDQYAACNNFQIEKGRDICLLDIKNYSQVCVLGSRAAKEFFDYRNPVGETMTLDGVPFTVVGVYREKDPSPEWSLDNVVVFPYTATRALGRENQMSEFVVKVKSSEYISDNVLRLQAYVNSLGGPNMQYGGGYAYSESQWQESQNEQALMLSLVLGGIAFISLLVGGIGIMNIMLVTVSERTREIGIRRAIGAERRSIVTQFLMEAGMICGVGGIIGIAIGFGLTALAGKLLVQTTLLPSVGITMGAFAFSVVLGILFGMYPAVKASGLQPVEALRAE